MRYNYKLIMVLPLFLIWQIINLAASFLASRLIPYLGFFPYRYVLESYHLPALITSLANFDGIHYILIAQNGYTQYQQAFFPLYPLLIRFLSPLLAHNELITGLLISNLCFLAGLIIFQRYLNLVMGGVGGRAPGWTIIFLLVFPTSFFFTALYTEGLFFFLVVASLYFLEKENYWLASLFALLASLTRLTGLFLIIIFGLKLISKIKNKSLYFILNTKYLLLLLSPIIGFLAYCLYLLKTTGDFLFFFHSQPAFGAHRSTNLIILPQVYYRYFKIILTAHPNFQYLVSLVEASIFSLVFIVLVFQFSNLLRHKNSKSFFSLLGLNIFSLANITLPTLTGTFSSVPRYSLMSLSFFIALGGIKNPLPKILLAALFFILDMVLLGFFVQGYFIS